MKVWCEALSSVFLVYATLRNQSSPLLILCIFCEFYNRRAPNNDGEWSDFRTEISHMRPIQGKKLKLFKVMIYGGVSDNFHFVLMFPGIRYFVCAQYRNDVSLQPGRCSLGLCKWAGRCRFRECMSLHFHLAFL